MDPQSRLAVLRHMLARLTGAEPPAPPAPVKAAVFVPAPLDPRERRLKLLQSMLAKLQSS